jgi:RHS repeat-associated protein
MNFIQKKTLMIGFIKISKIVWRVDGKVKEIQRMTGSTKWLKFDYDAMGNRIAKHVYNYNGTVLKKSTYYILDAQGNQISTYDHEIVGGSARFHLKERNIFGSSRIGSKQDSLNILTATLTQNYTQVLGTKYYEFSNHLGNVLTVFSDVKIALDANSNGVVDGFRVPIRNTVDYSPFGVQLDGRTIQGDFYRRGFNGMEKDDEVKGGGNSYDFGARMYDSRVGLWLTIDAFTGKYPYQSPYNFVANSPLRFVDPDGNKIVVYNKDGSIGNNNSNIKAFLDNSFSGKIETQIDKNGVLTFHKVGDTNPIDLSSLECREELYEGLNDKQIKAFLILYNESIDQNEDVVLVDLYKSGVTIGSFNKVSKDGLKAQLVDVYDMLSIESSTNGEVSALGLFSHELIEGKIGQNSSILYSEAHNDFGEETQAYVDGFESVNNGDLKIETTKENKTTTYHFKLSKPEKNNSQEIILINKKEE